VFPALGSVKQGIQRQAHLRSSPQDLASSNYREPFFKPQISGPADLIADLHPLGNRERSSSRCLGFEISALIFVAPLLKKRFFLSCAAILSA
jgi:hypothetical protein